MEYYRKEDEYVVKYYVSFDTNEIENIKEKIILNCSEIEHFDYKGEKGPKKETEFIRNLVLTPLQKIYKCGIPFDTYRFEFDKYTPPFKLVEKIDDFIDKKPDSFQEILKYYSYFPKEVDIDFCKERLNRTKAMLEFAEDEKYSSVIDNYKKEISENEKELEMKLNMQKAKEYYEELLGSIELNENDYVLYSEYAHVNNFLGNLGIDIDTWNQEAFKLLKK